MATPGRGHWSGNILKPPHTSQFNSRFNRTCLEMNFATATYVGSTAGIALMIMSGSIEASPPPVRTLYVRLVHPRLPGLSAARRKRVVGHTVADAVLDFWGRYRGGVARGGSAL